MTVVNLSDLQTVDELIEEFRQTNPEFRRLWDLGAKRRRRWEITNRARHEALQPGRRRMSALHAAYRKRRRC